YEKYKDKGFIVVGVHTPEFEFEKKTENVQGAINQYNIHYPVPQDNDYKTWFAYNNHYWPAKYLIDVKGNIRYTHFGEGEYEETEKNIQTLLKEAGNRVKENMVDLEEQTPRVRLTPETYLGLARMERLASAEEPSISEETYTTPELLPRDFFALGGVWNIQDEFSSAKKGSVLELRFYANKVFLVITPQDMSDKIKVYLDGKLADASNVGKDVQDGYVVFNKNNPNSLYNLIDLGESAGEHLLRLEFETEETKIFAFTFG
ncbi:cytochrome c biogenesis protein DipZ, partial [Candidatus Roizmanbacteria bacterium]|nr:cytochrome c biogenesis protein DipZ [Candidatus Roizmanbacteria bacterium]